MTYRNNLFLGRYHMEQPLKWGEMDLYGHSGANTYWQVINMWIGDRHVAETVWHDWKYPQINERLNKCLYALYALEGVPITTVRRRVKLRHVVSILKHHLGPRIRCNVCGKPAVSFDYKHIGSPINRYGFISLDNVATHNTNRPGVHDDCWASIMTHYLKIGIKAWRQKRRRKDKLEKKKQEVMKWVKTQRTVMRGIRQWTPSSQNSKNSSLRAYQSQLKALKRQGTFRIS